MRKDLVRPFSMASNGVLQNYVGDSGFSLIEVLVAIIILSIGMLGAVGMQTTAMQSNKESRNQAAATSFARDLAERMRGNNTVAVIPTGTLNPYLFDVNLGTTSVVSTALNCFSAAGGCPNPVDAAKWDVYDWQTRVKQELPSPRVKVCFDNAPFDAAGKPRWACVAGGDIAVLKISWNRNDTAGKLTFTSATTDTPALVLPLTAGVP